MNKISVIGSLNMDTVLKVKEIVKVGETITSNSMEKFPGGKGANQAVAARRSGAEVYMIGKVGQDGDGHLLVKELEKDEINTKFMCIDEKVSTGTAIIMVENSGDNSIVIVPGANFEIKKEEIRNAKKAIENSDIVITQFETPEEIAIESFKLAKELGKVTILNPAPAKKVDDELLKYTDIIIPNETEAETLTGIKVCDLESAKKAAEKFMEKGIKWVIITLGEKGAALISKDNLKIIPAYKVNAVDTTAAGDSFIGGLSSVLDINNLNEETLSEAIKFGNKVSSIAVCREGAQCSIPYLEEVIKLRGEN